MPNGQKGVLPTIEQKLGLPPLSKLAKSLDRFPDARQLRLIKETLEVAERICHTSPELDKVVMLIAEINSMPLEKLEKLEKLLKRIEGIVSKAPDEFFDFVKSLKEE